MPHVLLASDLYIPSRLSDIHLPALARYTVQARSFGASIILKRTKSAAVFFIGMCLVLMLCLPSRLRILLEVATANMISIVPSAPKMKNKENGKPFRNSRAYVSSRLALTVVQQPNAGQGRLILEVSRSHKMSHQIR
jgi:hypothetical protein